jgi:predicted ATPase/DNA-binding CsgD family transcriptional regulator
MDGSGPARRYAKLPAETTRFVGRRHETAAVRRLLTTARLVTLTGPGGVGKSRLALHVAGHTRRAFPDGVWLVDLAALHDPQLLARTVVDTLGIRDASARPAGDVLIDHLADRGVLLVLDNCEHLLDACAQLVPALLRSAPGVRVLATSREPLRVDGEHVFVVPPLPVPEPERSQTDEELRACDAVALFADRVAQVAPDFELDPSTAATVARLVRQLDGMPLAIELAAVRIRALSLDEILDRLTDSLRWLNVGNRVAPARQRTLRATIDWSYALCSPTEQALWARLSVFAGGFDLVAAEAVCAGGDIDADAVVDLLEELVNKNVALREEHDSRVRFHLLETIRQYGRERLIGSGDEAALRRRHRDWYQRLVTRTATGWHSRRQLDWFTQLRWEHPNLRAAFDFCLTTPGEVGAGLRMACGLRSYWHASGAVAEGRRWLDRLLELYPEPDHTRAEALRVAAFLALFHNDVTAARPLAEQARALAAALDDPSMTAWATHVVGFATLFAGDVPRAVGLFERALADFRRLDDPGAILVTLFYLSSTLALVDPEHAEPLGQEAVALSTALDEHWMRSWTLWTLGVIAWRRGDTLRAVDLERDAIGHKQLFDDRFGVGQCIEVLAWSAATDGQHERAARLLGGLTVLWQEVHASLYRHLDRFHDEVCRGLRQDLGARAFDAAFAAGTRLTYHQVVDDALARRPARTADRAPVPTVLTGREFQIAELIARGMSNRQIAAALVISPRTADTHVEHILGKLGFGSRTQIARWITQHGHGAAGTAETR